MITEKQNTNRNANYEKECGTTIILRLFQNQNKPFRQ